MKDRKKTGRKAERKKNRKKHRDKTEIRKRKKQFFLFLF